MLDAANPAKKAGLQVAIGGYVGQELSKPDTGASDKIGIAAAMVILLLCSAQQWRWGCRSSRPCLACCAA